MNPILTLRYTPEKNDYAQVLRIYFFQQTGSRIALGFLVIAFAIIIYSVATQTTPITILQIVWLLLPPVFIVYVLFVQPRSMANRAIANEQLAAETTWEVGEQGIDISTSFGSSHLNWDELSQLTTSKEYYLLMLKGKKRAFRFLPRRVFTSPPDQDTFLQLVSSHLTK
jgi:hypothetical protein